MNSLIYLLSCSLVVAVAGFASTPETGSVPTRDIVSKVAVAGATGRTGSLVVQELIDRGVNVVAMVRDLEKASDVLGPIKEGLEILRCDLSSPEEINQCSALKECDAAIWCATGFAEKPKPHEESKNPIQNFLEKLLPKPAKSELGKPKEEDMISIDAVGLPAMSDQFAGKGEEDGCPKVIMLSSAGVTRPSWDDEKKGMFPGSADIPIVRLNPFGILGIKAASEQTLRQSGVSYCVVRPTGLNDDWPTGSRPVVSQGDLAVGRINRKDVAHLLVDILSTPDATGKTFEAFTLAGYSPAASISPALKKLKKDCEGPPDLEMLEATYSTLQQLLPGEKQDSAKIALGQTYEQMDKNEEGRFGKRGEERVGEITLKPTST
mmetsp:Transcript_27537/g.40683  ORF Transcript_27537/g.40683 Transcript_27537/m.40683 type:complete len:378 (+) Transcript_27537:57-1190(+)